jgi:hypothetical protein
VQKAWVALDVPQCGFCQCGMVMAAAALLKAKPKPTDADIDAAMTNICRCGTYNRVRAAIKVVAAQRQHQKRGTRHPAHRREHDMSTTTLPHPLPHRRRLRAAASWLRRRPAWWSASTFHSPARCGAGCRHARDQRLGGGAPDDTVVIRIARSEMGQGT